MEQVKFVKDSLQMNERISNEFSIGCPPQVLLSPFLNTFDPYKSLCHNFQVIQIMEMYL